jgi:dihydroorotase
VDPGLRVNRLADVAIRSGRIVVVQPNISASDADTVIDAAGKIVTPGLIDLHAHATDDIPAFALSTGVTSMLDAGTKGADEVAERVTMVKNAPNRVRVLLNLSRKGVTTPGELLDFDSADVDAARSAIVPHRDVIVGVKARLSRSVAGDHDLDAVRRAKAVTAAFGIPLMVHVGDSVSPLPQILQLLDRGDIVTHMYAPVNGVLDPGGGCGLKCPKPGDEGCLRLRERPARALHVGFRRARPQAVPARHDFVGPDDGGTDGPRV